MNDYCLSDTLQGGKPADPVTLALIILISINIGIEIFRFIAMLVLSNREQGNKRKIMIEENRLRVLEQLFKSLDELTLFDREQEVESLSKIKEISQFITKNKLYIPKPFQKISNEILDYFRNVLTDFRNRSFEKEIKLFEKYYDEFVR